VSHPPVVADQLGHSLPLVGSPDRRFCTGSGSLIAIGFRRVVIGGRGPYVDFGPRRVPEL